MGSAASVRPVGAMEMKSEKRAPAFLYRGLEQHYTVDFSAQNPENYTRQAEILQRASQIGLNRVYMGERWPDLGINLVDYAKTFPELATREGIARAAERRSTLERICLEAHRLGIDPWISYNVINYPDCFTTKFPDAIAEQPPAAERWMRTPPARGLSKQPQLCPSSASFKKLAVAQVTELCQLPHIGGIECFLTAADTDLFFCNCPTCHRKTMSELIREFAELILPVCKQNGKRLALRCYLGGWRCALETEVWHEAAPLISPEIEITYKQQQGDLMNWHGPNPLAGTLAPHMENVEFDVYGEYRGVNYGIICSVRWQMSELIKHYRDKGVKGILCRGLDNEHLFDLDKWLFGELAQNPDMDVAGWCADWAAKRYGAAGDKVLSILDDCAEVIRLSMYVRGVQWASWAVPQNLSRLRFILFDRSAPCTPGAFERLQPTPENLAAIAQEKKTALQKANEILARCNALDGELDDRFLKPLSNSVRYLQAYVALSGPLMDAFFTFLAWGQSHSEVTREYHRHYILSAIETAEQSVRSGRESVRRLDLEELLRLSELAGFVQSTSLETKYDEPFHNARVILQEIRDCINTSPASWWSVYPWPERWPASMQGVKELYRGG
ncbi:MAG: hypothetical protein WCD79_14655 [Chthoniobacteraceae bacterium]